MGIESPQKKKVSSGLVVPSSSQQVVLSFCPPDTKSCRLMDSGHTGMSQGQVFVNASGLCEFPAFYGAFVSLAPPEKVPLSLWPTGLSFSFVVSLTSLGNNMLCPQDRGAGGKALLKTAGYCSVNTRKPRSSREECLEAGPRRKELQMSSSHSSKGRPAVLIKASQEIIKAN